MSDLSGKTIIVTGAGGSIGRAAALILARRGANVVVADIVEAAAEETVRLIRAEGGNAVYSHCDVSIEDNAWSTVELAITEFGRLDGAFNNAGLPPVSVPLHQLTSADFQRSLDINVLGVFHCMKHQIAAMLKAGSGGSIVNTASVGGTVAIPAQGEYVAAKHAVIGLTRIAAVDYGQQGIRVNAVLPGAIRTPMLMSVIENDPSHAEFLKTAHPIGRYGEPAEIGETAAWLLSDASSFVTGAAIAADGGYTAI